MPGENLWDFRIRVNAIRNANSSLLDAVSLLYQLMRQSLHLRAA